MQVEKVDKALQKAKLTDIYVKMIKLFVLYTPRIKIQKNLHYVTVTFQGVSEKLTLMISERGKNYANIRWMWQERDDFSTLKTNLGEILATQCVSQTSERLSGQ